MTYYFSEMAKACEWHESNTSDESLKRFWHNAKIGFKRKWADQLKGELNMNDNFKMDLKNILYAGYNIKKDGRQKRKLKAMGFDIEEHRKHMCLIYHGKYRDYKFAVAKTPSDPRGVKNLVSEIVRTLQQEPAAD